MPGAEGPFIVRPYEGLFRPGVPFALPKGIPRHSIGSAEDVVTSPTPDASYSEPSHSPPASYTKIALEPAVMYESNPVMRTEGDITPEPEPHRESDQMRKPATPCVTEGLLVEFEAMEGKAPSTSPPLRRSIALASGNILMILRRIYP